ncbi:hypothetical protein L596_023746 [Steinernema carpocapsae]|uniref:Uncharacterized protein n=1 Tax=Steinernema carpocapsae TaxID=34508 RepID=A0A4U5MFC5_STECR|nr:hypothetical protein L596_023746 [Steinernema carpocapsae]
MPTETLKEEFLSFVVSLAPAWSELDIHGPVCPDVLDYLVSSKRFNFTKIIYYDQGEQALTRVLEEPHLYPHLKLYGKWPIRIHDQLLSAISSTKIRILIVNESPKITIDFFKAIFTLWKKAKENDGWWVAGPAELELEELKAAFEKFNNVSVTTEQKERAGKKTTMTFSTNDADGMEEAHRTMYAFVQE